jgi:hypothetical protein
MELHDLANRTIRQRGYSRMTRWTAIPENLAFELTGGVSEPSTWAMMLLGFAGLNFAGYRKTARMSSAAA